MSFLIICFTLEYLNVHFCFCGPSKYKVCLLRKVTKIYINKVTAICYFIFFVIILCVKYTTMINHDIDSNALYFENYFKIFFNLGPHKDLFYYQPNLWSKNYKQRRIGSVVEYIKHGRHSILFCSVPSVLEHSINRLWNGNHGS